MKKFGFVLLDNTKGDIIPHDLVDRIRSLCVHAFDRSPEEKIAMHVSTNHGRGFFSSRDYHEINRDPSGVVLNDNKEGFFLGNTQLDNHPNILPPGCAHEIIDEYMDLCTSVCRMILTKKLGITHLSVGNPITMMKLLKYPPINGVTDAHADYGCLTLLYASGPGLEIFQDGKWEPIHAPDHCFILNAGDYLSYATGDLIKSTLHRVIYEGNEDRYSIPFFFHADASESVMTPNGQEDTLTYIQRRFDSTYDYRKKK